MEEILPEFIQVQSCQMLTFLFWNMQRRNLSENLARLVDQHTVDMVILAESDDRFVAPILSCLPQFDYVPDDNCPRIQIYTRFSHNVLQRVSTEDKFRVLALPLIEGGELMVMACHLLSLTHSTPQNLNIEAILKAEQLRRLEEVCGHQNTLVVGDLNLTPFSEGVISARGFHAVMTQNLARKESRVVQGNRYPYFYNPMWSRMGDASPGPPGSYFFDSSGDHFGYFWYFYDQVLLRPSLLDFWRERDLILPTSDGVVNFLKDDGTPDRNNFSDHLPLVFRLNVSIRDDENE